LIPEHASVASTSQGAASAARPSPARSPAVDGVVSDHRKSAVASSPNFPSLELQAPAAIDPIPPTERVGERQEEEVEVESDGDADDDGDEALDGMLGPLLPREFGGITGEYIYTGEVFLNAKGGIATANSTRYRGNLDIVVQIDTQKQQLWNGGRFFLYGESTHGRSISEDYVGDFQLISNLDPTPKTEFAQISEYWYRHDFAEGEFGLKIGKQDACADYAFADLGGDFINASFGMVPTVPLPTFPNPGLGVACFARLHEHLLISGGIYDGLPDGGQWGFSDLGENGCMSLTQVEIRQPPDWGNGLPGTLRIGAWYHSGNPEEIVADPHPRILGHNYGFWATADKMLVNETGEEGDEQGLGVFGQFGWAPEDRNEADQNYAGGIIYRGPFQGRDLDVIGVGATTVLFGSPTRRITGMTHELATEVFYKAYLSDFVALQFDLQYITSPGGAYPDSMAPGVRFEVVL
jgi:porin